MSNNMSPESSPSSPESFGGKRVNNLPLIIGGACLVIFVVIVVLVASERAATKREKAEENLSTKNSASMALQAAGPLEGGFINGPAKPKEDLPETVVGEPAPKSFLTDTKTGVTPSGPDPYEKERAKIKDHNFKLLSKAIIAEPEAKLSARYRSGGSAGSTNKTYLSKRDQMLAKISDLKRKSGDVQEIDPTKAYQARLAAIKATMGSGGSPKSSKGFGLASVSGGSAGDYEDSLFNPDNDWRLKNQIEAPETAFTLRAGFVIPGIMITGINSELPGRISGQISQNVYDTATGTQLLLPQGTRLDGSYVSDVAYGQSRLMIAWNRLIFPDGKALDIGKMPGADSAGYAGFSDKVNNHYFRIFGSALLMSGITAGISYATNDNSSLTEQPFSDSMSEALANNLGQVMLQMIKKNLNLSPTLEIRPGYRFNILTVKDLVFTGPYQQFDY